MANTKNEKKITIYEVMTVITIIFLVLNVIVWIYSTRVGSRPAGDFTVFMGTNTALFCSIIAMSEEKKKKDKKEEEAKKIENKVNEVE